MIELKNISKTYKSKKSKNTKALDNITLNLDEKGMTFILGKSGSGKSTLLNVLGGLDKYDSGEMIILGKSSKNFTKSDFDSYRNTYIGFIFQEFNILEDYDVYENIVLALQLQQKPINKEEVDELLEKLELTELKKRKVNELSGGQKQRVAIARALIKNPKIILADEPTGNLDSKTGKQVMELLKEVAKEKLVVVVSHDEEYAQIYGDRIVEIKDGKIIRDTKELKQEKQSKNIYKAIKSKLPFKASFKLGGGSLKHKKIKLTFTILLTIITLGFFSCTDTLSNYSYNKEHIKLLLDNNEQFVQVENHITIHGDDYSYKQLITMDDASSNNIKNLVGSDGYNVYQYNGECSYGSTLLEDIFHVKSNENNYSGDQWELEIVTTSDISKILKEKIIGRNPEKENEVVISNYLADIMIKQGVEVYETTVKTEFKTSNIFEPKTYEDIINAPYTYYFGDDGKVKIVGIISYDYNNKPSSYKNNVLNKVYVSNNFVNKSRDTENIKSYFVPKLDISGIKPYADYVSTNASILSHEIEYFDGNSWKKTNSLKENEVILHINHVADYSSYYEDLDNYLDNRGWEDYNVSRKKFMANFINGLNVIGKEATLKLYYGRYNELGELYQELKDLKVIGVYIEEAYDNSNNNTYGGGNYFSKELLDNYIEHTFEKTGILYPMTSKKDFSKITKLFSNDNEKTVKSTYSEQLIQEQSMFNTLKKVSYYIGVVFLVFAIILIINFMFTSISYRKREIGVLRALGARSLDTIKIFIWEGIIMSLISGTIASILLVIVTNFLNQYIMSRMAILSTPFIVGIRQFLVIYLLVFSVTIIASILPILKISKMRPIDAILNK